MKNVLLLVDKITERKKAWADLLQRLLGEGHAVELALFQDVALTLEAGNVGAKASRKNLLNFDLVYFLKAGGRYTFMGSVIAQILAKHGKPFVDSAYKDFGPYGNKLNSLVKLALASVPIPISLYVPIEQMEALKDEILGKMGLPVFVKDLNRQRRSGLFVVEKANDFNKLIELKPKRRGFIFQKAIKIAREYRLVVIGGKIGAAHVEEARIVKENTIAMHQGSTKGGFVDVATVPQEMAELAVRAAKLLNLDVAGVDICEEHRTGRYFIFEVNRGPGLTLDPDISPEMPELAKFVKALWK